MLIGVVLILILAPVFQATVMISMAKVPSIGNDRNSAAIAVSNIEEPGFLIERLKIPSTYTPAVIASCRVGSEETNPESMVNMIRAGIPRSVDSVAIIRIKADTPGAATQCADSLFKMIRAQQESMVIPLEQDIKSALSALEKRLSEGQLELRRAERESDYKELFFAKRDELLFLNQQIYVLQRGMKKITPTRIVTPIYANINPVSPSSALVLSVAILVGIFFGFLLVGFREYFRQHTESTEALT